MSDTSRRNILGVAVAGAVGTAGAVAIGGGPASAASTSSHETIVVHLKDPASGVLSVMVGEQEHVVRDPDLVSRIVRAAGGK